MSPPAVSALVLSRRRPGYLRGCLASLRGQDHPGIEIHVLANGCAETAAMVRAEHSDVRLHESPDNLGCPLGRDRLAREVDGEYLLFLDDDGELRRPDIVARLVAALEADPRAGVASMALVNAVTDEPTGWRRMASRLDYPCYHASFAGGACLFRRRAFLEAGGYATRILGFGEEFDLSVRLYAAGWAVLHFPEVVFHHFVDKDDDAWREQLSHGYRHLQYTVRRLYPGVWCWLAGIKSLVTHLYVELRLHGGGRLDEEIAGSHRWWARGTRDRAPVPRRALERLYFAKYHRVEDWETLRRAPAGFLWRVPWLRLRRKIRRVAKLDLPRTRP